jgi:predicted TIM-barrel fold metal-dependent hydrolase
MTATPAANGAELELIDAWVNPNQGARHLPPPVGHLFADLAERRRRGTPFPQLVAEMDAARVRKAVLCVGYGGYDAMPWMTEAMAAYPGRFAGSIVVDPQEGMAAVRRVATAVRDNNVRLVRMMALQVQRPYNDAVYYPVYAKCAELGVPVGLNVGIPGPRVASRHQHPLSIDDVCAFFPELTVIMSHGGDPWGALCAKLMLHWENLHYMSSAYAPKRLPREILEYANWRGADKIMWASDYPVLEFERCRREITEMPFAAEETRHKFAYGNADRMFFS